MATRNTYKKSDFAWMLATDIKIVSDTYATTFNVLYIKVAELKALAIGEVSLETVREVLSRFDVVQVLYGNLMSKLFVWGQTHTDAVIRETALSITAKAETEFRDMMRQKVFFEFFSKIKEKKLERVLEDEESFFFENLYKDYSLEGFHLPKENQKAIQKISKKIDALEARFSQNLNNYKKDIFCTKEELFGVPNSILEVLLYDETTQKYTLPLRPDIYYSVMETVDSASVRKTYADAFSRRGGTRNAKVLDQLVLLRVELARQKGYKTIADTILPSQMAKNTKTVARFLQSAEKKVAKKYEKEMTDLVQYYFTKKGTVAKKDDRIPYFDVLKISAEYEKEHIGYDEEVFRAYFPYESVWGATEILLQKEFGVSLYKEISFPKLAKEILWYRVEKDGTLLGYLCLDLFPRTGKYGHACAENLQVSYIKNATTQNTPVALVVCNFRNSTHTLPSLLSHTDIETFLHELGHAFHVLFSNTRFASLSAFTTPYDFVEIPSQYLEQYAWERDFLLTAGKHYKTGEKISEEMLETLQKKRSFGKASAIQGQLWYASIDQKLHGDESIFDNGSTINAHTFWKMLTKKSERYIESNPRALRLASFGHLASPGGGYVAKYYSYLWSLLYACEMQNLVMSTEGKKEVNRSQSLREMYKNLLQKGAALDGEKELHAFLGGVLKGEYMENI
jgi:Zn-dependent oligopeptidase